MGRRNALPVSFTMKMDAAGCYKMYYIQVTWSQYFAPWEHETSYRLIIPPCSWGRCNCFDGKYFHCVVGGIPREGGLVFEFFTEPDDIFDICYKSASNKSLPFPFLYLLFIFHMRSCRLDKVKYKIILLSCLKWHDVYSYGLCDIYIIWTWVVSFTLRPP